MYIFMFIHAHMLFDFISLSQQRSSDILYTCMYVYMYTCTFRHFLKSTWDIFSNSIFWMQGWPPDFLLSALHTGVCKDTFSMHARTNRTWKCAHTYTGFTCTRTHTYIHAWNLHARVRKHIISNDLLSASVEPSPTLKDLNIVRTNAYLNIVRTYT
jgi:hypothetical protein